MSFISDLERLKEKATKGPWICVFQADGGYDCMSASYDLIQNSGYLDKYLCTLDVRNYAENDDWETLHSENDAAKSNAQLIALLRNHADEIAELVKAMESIANNACCEGCQEAKRVAQGALAALNKEKP